MGDKFRCGGIYASGMVLQRNTINCIFGFGAKGKVQLKFNGISVIKYSDENGNWKIEFDVGEAGGPYFIEIINQDKKIVLDDIYVGEVWVNSGQSNAQLPMDRMKFSYKDEFDQENNQIRMITIPISYSFDKEIDSIENPKWLSVTKDNLKLFSGTGYFFAKKLYEELKIPIGIINASQGGSPIYSWMNRESLKQLNRQDYLDRIDFYQIQDNVINKKNNVLAAQQKWDSDLLELDEGEKNKWWLESNFDDNQVISKKFNIPGDFTLLKENGGVVWFKKDFIIDEKDLDKINGKNLKIWFGTIQDADKIWINNEFCGATYYTYPPRRYDVPKNALKLGKNTIIVRIQKNGEGPIRFYDEKNYCLFTDDVVIHPVAYRNVEVPDSKICLNDGFYLDLSGEWDYKVSCITSIRPSEMFFEWEPSALFNSMLAPCFNYAVAGALWYQGESNAQEYESYKPMMLKLMELWRNKFVYAKKNMPFVLMQLPNWADGYRDEKMQNFGDWAEMRDAVRMAAMEDSNAASVCMIDGGEWNDLHPEKKKTGGSRAAIEALRIAYGRNLNSFPKLEYCESRDNIFTIRFDCGKSGLKAYKVIDERADFNVQISEVYGFELMTKSRKKIPVSAELVSDSDVEVQIPLSDPNDVFVELHYLWSNNPWIVNLYSSDNLPAMPFRIYL